jgi:hypothetical protein
MSSSESPKHAFVTMVTSDSFVVGADVMIFSLKETGTKVEIVVLVTPQVSKAQRTILEKRGAQVREVEPLANPSEDVHVEGWINSGKCPHSRDQLSLLDRYRLHKVALLEPCGVR